MPTALTSKWPKPKSEDEFEDIVLDALKIRWADPNATRNGRRGQRQNGVDIYGKPYHLNGGVSGAQCKNSLKATLQIVKREVEKATTFEPPLLEYLFVVAADRDVDLQQLVRLHFKESPAPFAVEIAFWDDIIHSIAEQPDLIRKHWPTIAASNYDKSAAATSASDNVPGGLVIKAGDGGPGERGGDILFKAGDGGPGGRGGDVIITGGDGGSSRKPVDGPRAMDDHGEEYRAFQKTIKGKGVRAWQLEVGRKTVQITVVEGHFPDAAVEKLEKLANTLGKVLIIE